MNDVVAVPRAGLESRVAELEATRARLVAEVAAVDAELATFRRWLAPQGAAGAEKAGEPGEQVGSGAGRTADLVLAVLAEGEQEPVALSVLHDRLVAGAGYRASREAVRRAADRLVVQGRAAKTAPGTYTVAPG